jgi:hypothetical protein
MTLARTPKHGPQALQLLRRRVMEACDEAAADGGGGSGSSAACVAGLQPVNKCPSVQELQAALMRAVRCVARAPVRRTAYAGQGCTLP